MLGQKEPSAELPTPPPSLAVVTSRELILPAAASVGRRHCIILVIACSHRWSTRTTTSITPECLSTDKGDALVCSLMRCEASGKEICKSSFNSGKSPGVSCQWHRLASNPIKPTATTDERKRDPNAWPTKAPRAPIRQSVTGRYKDISLSPMGRSMEAEM